MEASPRDIIAHSYPCSKKAAEHERMNRNIQNLSLFSFPESSLLMFSLCLKTMIAAIRHAKIRK
jgi:hypothetical protein